MIRWTRRITALLAALFIPMALGAALAPSAHATPGYQWYVHYGYGQVGTSPNVWSNRSPTWKVGTTPNLTAQTDGNLVDRASFCPNGVCWASNTANAGPGPWQFWWDSRPLTSGTFRIYSSDGVIRFDTHTSGWSSAQMVLWNNGCLDIYGYGAGGWGAPIWENSANPACYIVL